MLDRHIKKGTVVRTVKELRCSDQVRVGTTGTVLGIRPTEDLMLVKYSGKSWPVATDIMEVKIVAY